MAKYNRSINELRTRAALWWPEELKNKNALANVLPLLLKTQEDFLRLIVLSKNDPFQLFDLIKVAKYPSNLFLKHLAVLADYGGEPIQRLGRSFKEIFPKRGGEKGKYYFDFIWKEKTYRYEFKALPVSGLNNKKLFIDGEGLIIEKGLDNLTCDMIELLLFASTSDYADQAGLCACEIGTMLGNEDVLIKYVKQRYITVSRITGGATANSLGQLAQTEIVDFLVNDLSGEYKIIRNGYIAIDGYDKKGGMPFDLVVEKGTKKVGIEVTFQVTTNSTIERKAGQAADRQTLMHKNGYQIAYVIDGAGNFQRSSAISTICDHSDCTVAYTIAEFKVLSNWIKTVL
ncbi:hypothetical protein [Methyloglobulus sp.]|uniref:hypothetical protein n=1 Tax=Methyloglobulus sp. TaxID=2518622 RepID=UPI003989E791